MNGFIQSAYDEYSIADKSATLRSSGGNYGGGSESLIVYNEETITNKTNASKPKPDDPCHTLGATGAGRALLVNNEPVSFYPQMKAESQCVRTDVANTLVNGTNPGFHNGLVDTNYIVRRLTPLECERLQGFPDGWTDIGDYTDGKGKVRKTTDSHRYKALGNSIAIPPWFYVLAKLTLCCGADTTMGSLFDGIGGFPYIWETLNGKGSCLWASEIEDFPIAVTKQHFPEKE